MSIILFSQPDVVLPTTGRPTIQDVAALIPLRTITRGGQMVLDFTSDTTPDAATAQKFIDTANDYLFGRLGDPADWRVPADDVADYQNEEIVLVKIYAAMLIELGLYSDQVQSGQSPYKELKQLFDDGLNGMLNALGLPGGDATTGSTERPAPASWSFPETSIGDGVMP